MTLRILLHSLLTFMIQININFKSKKMVSNIDFVSFALHMVLVLTVGSLSVTKHQKEIQTSFAPIVSIQPVLYEPQELLAVTEVQEQKDNDENRQKQESIGDNDDGQKINEFLQIVEPIISQPQWQDQKNVQSLPITTIISDPIEYISPMQDINEQSQQTIESGQLSSSQQTKNQQNKSQITVKQPIEIQPISSQPVLAAEIEKQEEKQKDEVVIKKVQSNGKGILENILEGQDIKDQSVVVIIVNPKKDKQKKELEKQQIQDQEFKDLVSPISFDPILVGRQELIEGQDEGEKEDEGEGEDKGEDEGEDKGEDELQQQQKSIIISVQPISTEPILNNNEKIQQQQEEKEDNFIITTTVQYEILEQNKEKNEEIDQDEQKLSQKGQNQQKQPQKDEKQQVNNHPDEQNTTISEQQDEQISDNEQKQQLTDEKQQNNDNSTTQNEEKQLQGVENSTQDQEELKNEGESIQQLQQQLDSNQTLSQDKEEPEKPKSCFQKCKQKGGISCKIWTQDKKETKSSSTDGSTSQQSEDIKYLDHVITCCKFTGCQWPFSCHKDSFLQIEGCENRP